MHLLLLLSEGAAAGRPCALRSASPASSTTIGSGSTIERTPLVPILRLPDLRRAGCELQLPESRMRTDVPGQQIWVSVGAAARRARRPTPARIRAVLRELARNDFALFRKNPPLLYHNDLTATVSRYYWSEDVGYALWLRLYDEYEHLGQLHPVPVGI